MARSISLQVYRDTDISCSDVWGMPRWLHWWPSLFFN